uniref:Uncharacterized protein n=1 Tax=Anguilla anguilla TaxID=7936 RepID=A0A0E9PEC4_ANGAN
MKLQTMEVVIAQFNNNHSTTDFQVY